MSGVDPGEQAGQDAAAECPPAEEKSPEADASAPVDIEALADFEPDVWKPAEMKYGRVKMMGLRQAMLPIEKPASIKSLKYLHFPGHGLVDEEPPERERRPEGDRRDRRDRDDRRDRERDNKGKGKGKQFGGGRFVPEMGKTELQQGYVKGQWWRNTASNELAVIVRDGFSLMSPEIWKVPFGHYVQQSGPAEVFVSGQATGLSRMPVYPRGWVTADASSVGGPRYLETIQGPRWRVAFKSDTPKGDILVRGGVSLESEEVGCILFGSLVTQSGPQETLEDGIIRMPISWEDPEGGGQRNGWVTCDASSQGGPKFFAAAPEETGPEPPKAPATEQPPASASGSAPVASRASEKRAGATGAQAGDGFATTWDKNRVWKVANLEASANRSLPLITRADPYAPGTGRVPPDELVVRWLLNDEVVEQIGHSKKTRGYMVMPVRVLRNAQGESPVDVEEGWVTRRSVDKQKEGPEMAWLVEIRDGDEDDKREKRRSERAAKRTDKTPDA